MFDQSVGHAVSPPFCPSVRPENWGPSFPCGCQQPSELLILPLSLALIAAGRNEPWDSWILTVSELLIIRKQNCPPTFMSLDGTMRRSVFGDCDIAGETTACSKICNPGDCQKNVPAKRSAAFCLLRTNGQNRLWCRSIAQHCHRQRGVHCKDRRRHHRPNPNLARRAARRRKSYRQPTLPASVSTLPVPDSFVFGSPDQTRDRSQRRARPESVHIPSLFFEALPRTFRAPATVRARQREHPAINLRPRRRHARSASEGR